MTDQYKGQDAAQQTPLAEDKKAILEIEKLASEGELIRLSIRRLRRPWRDPETVLKALAVPISLISLVASFYVADLKTELSEANRSLGDVNRSLGEVTKKRQDLELAVQQLEIAKSNLDARNQSLEQQSKATEDKLASEQFDSTLDLIKKDSSPWGLPPKLPMLILELTKIVQSDNARRSQYITSLAHELDSEKRPRVRASLLAVLYEATGDYSWRERIKDEFLEKLKSQDQAVIFPFSSTSGTELLEAGELLLTEVSTWNERHRSRLSLELLSSVSLSSRASRDLLFDTFHLACARMWRDELNESRVDFDNVDLVLACIGEGRNFSLDRNLRWGSRVQALLDLRQLSEAAFTANVATILSDADMDRDTKYGMENNVVGLLSEKLKAATSDDEDEDSDIDVPRAETDAKVWKEWIETNKDFVGLYMDPKLGKLRIKTKQDHHIPL